MTLIVEEDKPLDPAQISFLRSWAVMAGADGLANLIEQPRLGSGGRRRNGFGVHKPALHRQTDPSDRESGGRLTL